jgi:heme/copper-type cytochrome/quinol oxidase subunit 4
LSLPWQVSRRFGCGCSCCAFQGIIFNLFYFLLVTEHKASTLPLNHTVFLKMLHFVTGSCWVYA